MCANRQGLLVVSLRVSVQAEPRASSSSTNLARRLEASGFDALLMGDHPGSGRPRGPHWRAAAAVTDRLRVGTYMLQCGVREPVHIAADAATLDILAPSRVLLGLSGGHTPEEWEDVGRGVLRLRSGWPGFVRWSTSSPACSRGRP